jgi:hypothetical protein
MIYCSLISVTWRLFNSFLKRLNWYINVKITRRQNYFNCISKKYYYHIHVFGSWYLVEWIITLDSHNNFLLEMGEMLV